MKTRPEIEVFGDLEFCDYRDPKTRRNWKCCGHFDSEYGQCWVYLDEGEPVKIEFDENTCRNIKCDQCKADYLKAVKD